EENDVVVDRAVALGPGLYLIFDILESENGREELDFREGAGAGRSPRRRDVAAQLAHFGDNLRNGAHDRRMLRRKRLSGLGLTLFFERRQDLAEPRKPAPRAREA